MQKVQQPKYEIRLYLDEQLRQQLGNCQNLVMIQVLGDDMEPTLRPGEGVIVDRDIKEVEPRGGLYAVELDDSLLVKRVQMISCSRLFRLISDNNLYPSIELPFGDVKIYGKVRFIIKRVF